MTKDRLHEEEIESGLEAAPAVALVIALQVLLALQGSANGWELAGLPWWTWLVPVVPEAVLVIALAWHLPRRRLEQMGRRRAVALALVAVISVANGLALVALIVSLTSGGETSGRQLLLKGLAVWVTNVIAFGLWFWELDRGGPVRRSNPDEQPPPDFQFPQMENPQLAEPGWHPQFVDYLYISFTNAVAFSPTDAMPLRRRVKALMLTESGVSAITVLLVAARAVSILD